MSLNDKIDHKRRLCWRLPAAMALLSIAGTALTMGTAAAQTPPSSSPAPSGGAATQTPDARPSAAPPDVRNCARQLPDKANSSLGPAPSVAAELDPSGRVVLTITRSSTPAITCYSILRTPAGVPDEPFLVWATKGVVLPPAWTDEKRFQFAGRYCCTLVVGDPTGYAISQPACVKIATSLAPPAPEPSIPKPPPPLVGAPDAGSGAVAAGKAPTPWWLFVVVTGAATGFGFAGVFLNRRRSS